MEIAWGCVTWGLNRFHSYLNAVQHTHLLHGAVIIALPCPQVDHRAVVHGMHVHERHGDQCWENTIRVYTEDLRIRINTEATS